MEIILGLLIFFLGLLLFYKLGFWFLQVRIAWAIITALALLLLVFSILNVLVLFPFFLLGLGFLFYFFLSFFSLSWKQALFLTLFPPLGVFFMVYCIVQVVL